jgi:hypothetical protein
MTYSARAVANTVIELSAKHGIYDLSLMKLQCLLFFTQSWFIKLYNQPLFDDFIERWNCGTMVRDVYNEFNTFGSSPINSFATDALGYQAFIQDHDVMTKELINRILDVYGRFSASQLANMMRTQETAWSKGNLHTIINFEDLKTGKV